MPTVSFQAPSDFTSEQASIERQRKLAEMLQAQSMRDDERAGETQVVSGWAIPNSPLLGLSRGLNKALGAYGSYQADERTKDLAKALRERTGEDFQKYIDISGRQAVKPESYSSEFSPETMETSGVPGGKQAALAFALSSPSPTVQQFAMKQAEPFTLGKDQIRYEGGVPVASNRGPTEFGTTPHYERGPNGTIEAVVYGKGGERKVIGPAVPINQYTTGTVDAANNLQMKMYEFNNLSATEKARFALEGQRVGISALEAYFNTGKQMPAGVNLPPNAPPPQFTPPGVPGAGVPPPVAPPPAAPPPQAAPPPVAPPVPRPPVAPVAPPPVAPPRPVPPPVQPGPALPPGLTPKGAADAAAAAATTTAKKQAELKMQLPNTLAQMEQTINVIDQLVGKPGPAGDAAMRGGGPHKGLSNLVGAGMPFAKNIPGTDAAGAFALHNQIQGQAFLEAFERLKGGGQITEIEGTKATQAINRMNIATNEKEYINAAREFQGVLRAGMKRAKEVAGGGGGGAVLRFDAQGNPLP